MDGIPDVPTKRYFLSNLLRLLKFYFNPMKMNKIGLQKQMKASSLLNTQFINLERRGKKW
ncbi:hypothetical protein BHS01_01655 [Lactococcus paracarnosus]|uniref:Uncharacterized protein n=1 Tax=Pseudolactococcus paracarnosus TaxID=2749962 RepID=A0A7L4WD13_9LACT|nr:hypothetical protein BHS01_01655 [Lactococcus paracarnosus]SPC38064.1 hypothetical protein LPICM02_50062 [Lactococcus piscium]